ncbi:NIPSNAP family protein [Streptomyces sp. YIM 98790]|uniref:NIPSNAP family protein n=1 Tax=Streptomyces sp. YIM 98790 TaxID=2689077 RepID=UPI001408C534|nr:NIPSNAP family protein [Streptomyces sp. YIM 98790]
MSGTTQLRIYTVKEGMLDEWARRWREEIVPLRLAMGFTIGGAWLDRERSQFIWLISYGGPGSFAERNAQYWASSQREEMRLDPDDYLVRTEERVVEPVL